ncbi:MAG: imidazoleglycerol-phosphate dehydratase HisB [Firmicutes bacterium]|nr:imidazoleglycerol-phosphate dehydratase HisB [Bacillota bacterium]
MGCMELSEKRIAEINRNTTETQISIGLDLDGTGKYNVDSSVPFLDHMLSLFAKHSNFDLNLQARGDIHIDYHHTVEDIGICMGKAIDSCLENKKGICRYGHSITPMDEALVLIAADISGRAFLAYDVEFPSMQVGNFDIELVEEFLRAFAQNAKITLHVKKLAGRNCHHIIEGIFKGLGRSLSQATKLGQQNGIPSTKGIL